MKKLTGSQTPVLGTKPVFIPRYLIVLIDKNSRKEIRTTSPYRYLRGFTAVKENRWSGEYRHPDGRLVLVSYLEE